MTDAKMAEILADVPEEDKEFVQEYFEMFERLPDDKKVIVHLLVEALAAMNERRKDYD